MVVGETNEEAPNDEHTRNVHTDATLGRGLQECFHPLTGHAINL